MKYPIKKEFFPFSHFRPPTSEKLLTMAASYMKTPRFIFHDSEFDVSRREIESFDGEKIEILFISPKNMVVSSPCLIYIHGGGFVLGAAKCHYKNAMRYAKEAGCKVVFVNYRLAPKYCHPVFFEDSYASFCFVYNHADELNIDVSRIGIGGDSAGATLAVGVCMMARDRMHPVKFLFQMLSYPYLDARGCSESFKKYTDTPMWNSAISSKIGHMTKVDRANPNYVYYSPVEAECFEGLPPAYIETAEFDCLHDDGILYAKLLKNAGVQTMLNETKGTMHGFDIVQGAPTTKAALKRRIDYMKTAFYGGK